MNKQHNSYHKWLQNFPFKKRKSHKYSRGQLIVVGGEKEMVGATLLSSEAALRTGVGSVKIICNKKTLPIYSLKFPSLLKKEINMNKFLIALSFCISTFLFSSYSDAAHCSGGHKEIKETSDETTETTKETKSN